MKAKYILLITGCISTMACSSLKSGKVASTEITNALSLSSSAVQQQSLRNTAESFSDSSASDYMLQIWPSGTFSFNLEEGFKGEAKKVVLKGKNGKAMTYQKLATSRQMQQSQKRDSLNLQTTRKQESLHKNKSSTTIWLYLLLIGFITLLFWRLSSKW